MSDQRIKIPRASDRLVSEVFQAAALKWGAAPVTIHALGFGRISNISLQSEPEGDWKTLLDFDSELIDHVALQVCGLNVTYMRGGQCQPVRVIGVRSRVMALCIVSRPDPIDSVDSHQRWGEFGSAMSGIYASIFGRPATARCLSGLASCIDTSGRIGPTSSTATT